MQSCSKCAPFSPACFLCGSYPNAWCLGFEWSSRTSLCTQTLLAKATLHSLCPLSTFSDCASRPKSPLRYHCRVFLLVIFHQVGSLCWQHCVSLKTSVFLRQLNRFPLCANQMTSRNVVLNADWLRAKILRARH